MLLIAHQKSGVRSNNHNENLSNVADKTFVVKKDNNGISHTTIQSSLNVDLHMNELEEMYNEIKI